MTKGAKAMALAFHYPVPERGGDRKSAKAKSNKETLPDFSKMRLSQARTILAYSPEVAKAVLAGAKLFDKAVMQLKVKGLSNRQIA